MPTEKEVEAGARVMADLPSIDAPKLPSPCWMGSARAILEAAEKVRASAGAKKWQDDYDQVVARINAAE